MLVSSSASLEARLLCSSACTKTCLEAASVTNANSAQADTGADTVADTVADTNCSQADAVADAVADTGSYQCGVGDNSRTNDTGAAYDTRNHADTKAGSASQKSATSFDVLLIFLLLNFLGILFGERSTCHECKESDCCEKLHGYAAGK